MTESRPARGGPRAPWVLRTAIVLCTGLVFGRVVGHALLGWDDLANTLGNPWLVPPSAPGLQHLWLHAYSTLYIPLTFTVWWLAAHVSLEPWSFHAASLLIHAAAGLAAFGLLQRLVRDDLAACAGALLFVLHPVQAESVGWMSGAKDLLCGLFSLLALARYVDFAAAVPGRRAYAWATVWFLLGLLSKPAAVFVPLLALVLDVGWLRRSPKKSIRDLAPWFAVALAWAAFAREIQPAAAAAPAALWARPFLAADALVFFASKIVLPIALAPDYGRTPERVLSGGLPILQSIAVLAVVVGLGFAARRGNGARTGAVALGLFVAGVAPVLGFLPFDFQRYSTVADHYLYTSMIGPAFLLAAFLAVRRSVPIRLAAGALLLACAARSADQVGRWRGEETIWRHTLAVNPRSWTAHNSLGQALDAEGRTAEAIPEFEAALAIRPQDGRAHYNLGTVLDRLDRTPEALPHLEEAVRLEPRDCPSRQNLGIALLRLERPAEAEEQLRAAIEIEPRAWLAHYYLAGALDRLGRTDEVLEHLKESVRLNPRFQPARADLQAVLKAQAAGG